MANSLGWDQGAVLQGTGAVTGTGTGPEARTPPVIVTPVDTPPDLSFHDAAGASTAAVEGAQVQRSGTPVLASSTTSPEGLTDEPSPSQQPQQQTPSHLNAPPKVGTRFSSGSVRILRNWFAGHERHPYPSAEDVEMLQNQTGLSRQQITNWLANCRRRSKFQTVRPASPHVRAWAAAGGDQSHAPAPIDIPARQGTPKPTEHLNPLQRWENSPPEHEAALVSDISRAVAASVGADPSSSSQAAIRAAAAGHRPKTGRSGRSSGNASSVSSAGTSRSSIGSGSHASAYSHTSRTSFDSLKRSANRRRRRATSKRQAQDAAATSIGMGNRLSLFQAYNTYQCTFCTETFKTKYDWQRHEKSLHLSLEEWICSPKGSTEVHPEKGVLCVYCGEPSPSVDHLNGHNHAACLERPFEERTFYRKDHLQQHLKLVHGTKYLKWPMEAWQVANKEVRSRCGFCDMQLATWVARADHLAEHFKAGSTMAGWKGDWGFEPAVLDMLDNAMPPYLIHYEQNSPLPFSAIQGPADTPTSAYELVKLELEYYMRNYHDANGAPPTDEQLQYEGCSIIFGAEVISSDPASSAPSWLRDVVMADAEITRKARIRPMKQVARSRMSQLKINGKANIFENCELEAQLRRHVAMHAALGLSISDYELQAEAAATAGRIEAQSLTPSARFLEFVTRLIWDSTEWLAGVRERALQDNETQGAGVMDESPQPPLLDLGMDGFGGMGMFSPQSGNLAGGMMDDMMDFGLGAAGGGAMAWPPLGGQQMQAPHLFSTGSGLPGTGTSSPSGVHTPVVNMPTLPVTASGWVPMPETALNPGYVGGRGAPRQTSVTPFFLNDNNSYRRLARELSRFVASCMSPNNPNSHVPTDEELKYQARWILYDDDDPWNQTPVDNVEWLREFKKDAGLPLD